MDDPSSCIIEETATTCSHDDDDYPHEHTNLPRDGPRIAQPHCSATRRPRYPTRNQDAIAAFTGAAWFGTLAIPISIQFLNVVVWISSALDDATWLLGQPEHNGEHNKYRLQDK